MNFTTLTILCLAYLYAITPYFLVLFPFRTPMPLPKHILVSVVLATAMFCTVAPLISSFSLYAYRLLHMALVLAGGIFFLARRIMSPPPDQPAPSNATPCLTPLFIMALAVLARLIPVLWTNEWIGVRDANFHNILSQSILESGRLPASWEPFAPIHVNYPLGSHLLMAFMSDLSGMPVHHALSTLIAITAGLTTGVIYLLSLRLFANRNSALFSSACYAFLPFMGSLEYMNWGGIPNALGMLFLSMAVYYILPLGAVGGTGTLRGIIAPALCLTAVVQTHHYTALAACLFLPAAFVVFKEQSVRRRALLLFLVFVACMLTMPLQNFFLSSSMIGQTGVLEFRDPPLTILSVIRNLNPVLAVVFTAAVLVSRRITFQSGHALIFGWFLALFAAYVFLEYIYRGLVLLATGGKDCFTAITPTRMVSDMVYPMCVLCGFIPLAPGWPRLKHLVSAALFAACALSTCLTIKAQWGAGEYPDVAAVGRWLRANTPANSMICCPPLAGIEYLSWRETSIPPLPASERRKDPAVTWRYKLRTIADWLDWEARVHRPVYFIMPAGIAVPPDMRCLFSCGRVMVIKRVPQPLNAPQKEGIDVDR